MAHGWIGIGANVGEITTAFRLVCQRLADTRTLVPGVRSGLYQTRPIGASAGGAFTNAVFGVETSLAPLQLLDALQSLEDDLGRQRSTRWGPRPIDLDLITFEDMVLQSPRLTLPHPAAWYRRFVLDPLIEVAPAWHHPLLNESSSALRSRLSRRPLNVSGATDLEVTLQAAFPQVRFLPDPEVSQADVALWLRGDIAPPARLNGTPVADLSTTPGDAPRRVIDFLNSALDEPTRIGDWPQE